MDERTALAVRMEYALAFAFVVFIIRVLLLVYEIKCLDNIGYRRSVEVSSGYETAAAAA